MTVDVLAEARTGSAGRTLAALYDAAADRMHNGQSDPFVRRVLADLEVVLDQLDVR